MSAHPYTYYVSVKQNDRCRCGGHKARGAMLCTACIGRLPRGNENVLTSARESLAGARCPAHRSFGWVIEAYDDAVNYLEGQQ